MAVVNFTSLTGLLLILYLSTFVLFAILRIATGVSIQRIGYLSLRHITFTPRDGIRVDLRGLGLRVHRPTFVQPTWLSLRLTELHVTIDPSVTSKTKTAETPKIPDTNGVPSGPPSPQSGRRPPSISQRSKLWKRLTEAKETIKRMHRRINWLRMLDLVAVNTIVEVVDVGRMQVGSFTLAVDTRRKMVDRGRLFRHKKNASKDQRPAEWISVVRNVLLSTTDGNSTEVLENLSINIHGFLSQKKEGLRDVSVSVRLGRLHVPVDELFGIHSRFTNRSAAAEVPDEQSEAAISFEEFAEELDKPGSREEAIVQTVADSKEFISSLLRGVQELQLAMSWIRISGAIDSLPTKNGPLLLNVVTHEIGVDLHRLDSQTPAHRMYFSRDDVAHQALVAAISVSVSLGESESESNKLLYIPMATTTARTTLPAKTVSFSENRDVNERNANVLFSNFVITSPSFDLEPRHLPQLIALARRKSHMSKTQTSSSHRLVSRLLPKATIKISVQEPVIRFALPLPLHISKELDDYDLLIFSVSSISLDIDSSHSTTVEQGYRLSSNFRLVDHRLYYQTCAGQEHDLVSLETLELKTQVNAATDVQVLVSGMLRTFAIRMIKEEVSKGVYRVVKQFKKNVMPDKLDSPVESAPRRSFLRRIPDWLVEVQLEGSDFGVEIAGIDPQISPVTRGLALQLESWTASYQSQRMDSARRGSSSRRKTTGSSTATETPSTPKRFPHQSRKQSDDPTDGRRLAIHCKTLEGFIIESRESWEPEPFLSLPKSEVALSTGSDLQGSILHIISHTRALLLHVSLYRFYSLGVAGMVLKEAFLGPPPNMAPAEPGDHHPGDHEGSAYKAPFAAEPATSSGELIAVDVKASLVQVKAHLPHDPYMLLQIYDMAAGRHRWSPPFFRSHLVRLHAEAPFSRSIWARVVSVNNVRLDLREGRNRASAPQKQERSIDISTDFIRLAVPHGLRMHKVFDNFITTFKSVQQLRHRFVTRTNDYILEKRPERPKRVPKISIRSKALMLELEDDPFEYKLGLIYHVGQLEQRQRIAREEAFQAKVRKLEETTAAPRPRAQFSQNHRRKSPKGTERSHSRGHDRYPRGRSISPGFRGSRHEVRYDPDGICDMSSTSKVDSSEAWAKLSLHNARSWKRRIDTVLNIANNKVKTVRRMFAGADEPPPDAEEHETVLAIPARPGLMATIISDLHLLIDKPSFPLAEYPEFLHRIGKGMPRDMQYSLLIPMHVKLDMGEARVMLRDYPLNLLHIPAVRPGQSARVPSWSLETDFVIAEEFRDHQSMRHLKVDIIPPSPDGKGGIIPGFALDVRRTVGAVKTYSDISVDINTSAPTTFSWGTSYQPVIQDMMMIIEGFTKPEIDPSDRVGFWDKIRLSVHTRINVKWKGDGDVQLRLKGSRDPYIVTGYGAGFVMCWRNEVHWAIHSSEDPRKFMIVRSGEYVLAVPDFTRHARHLANEAHGDSESLSSSSTQKNAAVFKKVIMKLSGKVQWTAGLVFERDLSEGTRSFEFRPHYEVVLKNPKFIPQSELRDYDAFRGFRSDHIHLSVGVSAPSDREWSVSGNKPSESYNTVHLSPKFFTHFFSWWSLFSGVMSLPIRQGELWKGPEKTSKKFGRHLATIKYQLLLSPLFIAHIYKHKDAEEYNEETVSATGLKFRMNSFTVDVHQRREHFDTISKGKSKQTRTSGMRINQAQVDFIAADIRAVSANIGGTTADDLAKGGDDYLPSLEQRVASIDMSRFTIPDQDFSWIDMDDFVELDWVLPSESNPQTKILPLAYTPRFTYIRQTDHEDVICGDSTRTSHFGDEPTHFCVMTQENDPKKVQLSLIKERLDAIESQIENHKRLTGDQELRSNGDNPRDSDVREQSEMLARQGEELQAKRAYLQDGLKYLNSLLDAGKIPPELVGHNSDSSVASEKGKVEAAHVEMGGLYSLPNDDFAGDFDNKFIAHNLQLKWNNALRNTILRYTHQVSQRRGFIYYMSRRAVKFILDIVDEQSKAKQGRNGSANNTRTSFQRRRGSFASPTEEKDEDTVVEDRIEQLLNDAKRFVDADDPETQEQHRRPSINDFGDRIANDFTALNSYHVRLIAPQIQLQSEKNTKSVVLVAAKGMQLKVISIMERARVSDDVSGLVQRRFALDMDGAQFFVTTQKRFFKYLHLYSGNKYGNAPGSSWPPWVSLEVMFDFDLNPFGFQRIIQKTSASLRYEKYNPLRLKYNEQVAAGENGEGDDPENRVDHLWVNFPRIRAICDSTQYYAMYVIVLDLLLYSEPLEKIRSERLEKIMLASDFSDLRGAPEMTSKLQERIRQLEEIKEQFQLNAKYLDRRGWQDRIELEKDLANCEDELFFIMKAITTSQRKNDDRRSSEASGLLRWDLSASEIVWHLMRDKNEPLAEIQLRNAAYERMDNSDGSNDNEIEIEHIRGLNLLSNAIYPEIIGPFHDPKAADTQQSGSMFRVHWYMLEAIAGIPVLEDFDVKLYPLKIQLERDLGKKIFEYIFPQAGGTAFENGTFSPLPIKQMQPLDEDERSDAEDMPELYPSDANTLVADSESFDSSNPLNAIEPRLKPTLTMPYADRTPASSTTSLRPKGLGIISHPKEGHSSRFFHHANHSQAGNRAASTKAAVTRKDSMDSITMTFQPPSRSSTGLSSSSPGDDKQKRFALSRTASRENNAKEKDKDKPSDDLSQMMSRASNYMTLAHVKINSVVLCLSYKGKGERNIEDVHDFVFRMPVLEYRNKTWSNLDLALRLRRDVTKALISHTGAIIGNKFSHHRPSKMQQHRLRELATSSQILPNGDALRSTWTHTSESTMPTPMLGTPSSEKARSPRRSSASIAPSPLSRQDSMASSVHSSASSANLPVIGRFSEDRPRTEGLGVNPSALSRRLTSESRHNRPDRSPTEDTAETTKKKTVLLLGKKILGSRN